MEQKTKNFIHKQKEQLNIIFRFNDQEIKPKIFTTKFAKKKHSNETVQLRKYIQKIFFNPQLFPSNAEKC